MENKLTEDTFEEVLVDVRTSYRLLFLYQKRILDLVTFIGNHYKLDFEYGKSEFSTEKKSKLDETIWDSLAFNYRFVFVRNKKQKRNIKKFVILLTSDNSFYGYDANKIESLNFHSLNSPKDSETQVHLVQVSAGRTMEDYKKETGESNSKTVFSKKDESKKAFLFGKKYSLSRFINEESTLAALEEFEEFCSNEGYPMKPDVLLK